MFEIEHLKSGLSISTHIGCPLKCEYCVLQQLPLFGDKPKRISKPKEIIQQISKDNALFLDGETPLIINNRTDPFLPSVVTDTRELLLLLCQIKTKSPIIIITKINPNIDFSEFERKLRLIILYSYSNIKADYNYDNINDLDEIRKKFNYSDVYHYYRPIIPDINDKVEDIVRIIELFYSHGFSGTIISGIRITPNNRGMLSENISSYSNHKIIDNGKVEEIIGEFNNRHKEYPIFRHTSCAIDYSLKRANRLGYYNRTNHCNYYCPNINTCNNHSPIEIHSVMDMVAKKIGREFTYSIRYGRVEIENEISQEEIAFIRNAYGIDVFSHNAQKAMSEVYLSYE